MLPHEDFDVESVIASVLDEAKLVSEHGST